MRRIIGDVLTVFFVVAIMYLMVRPGSPSVNFVDAFSKGIASVVAEAADFI